MISLPSQWEPSSWLWYDRLTHNARIVLDSCQEIRRERAWGRLEQIAREATDLLDKQEDVLGCAVVLLHLADACRTAGKLGPALKHSEQARQLFLRHAAREQRINQAAATYSVGFLNHLLGADTEAQEWYAQAADLFREAREHWAIVGDRQQADRCDIIIRWVERLLEYLRDVHSHGEVSADLFSTLLCPWFVDEASVDYLLLKLRYEVVSPVQIAGEHFDVLPPGGSGTSVVTLNPGEDYFVLPLTDEGRGSLGTPDGDYVLVRQCDGDGEGNVLIDEDRRVVWGQFVRNADGSIKFVLPYTKKPRVIGNIVAVLRPSKRRNSG